MGVPYPKGKQNCVHRCPGNASKRLGFYLGTNMLGFPSVVWIFCDFIYPTELTVDVATAALKAIQQHCLCLCSDPRDFSLSLLGLICVLLKRSLWPRPSIHSCSSICTFWNLLRQWGNTINELQGSSYTPKSFLSASANSMFHVTSRLVALNWYPGMLTLSCSPSHRLPSTCHTIFRTSSPGPCHNVPHDSLFQMWKRSPFRSSARPI